MNPRDLLWATRRLVGARMREFVCRQLAELKPEESWGSLIEMNQSFADDFQPDFVAIYEETAAEMRLELCKEGIEEARLDVCDQFSRYGVDAAEVLATFEWRNPCWN